MRFFRRGGRQTRRPAEPHAERQAAERRGPERAAREREADPRARQAAEREIDPERRQAFDRIIRASMEAHERLPSQQERAALLEQFPEIRTLTDRHPEISEGIFSALKQDIMTRRTRAVVQEQMEQILKEAIPWPTGWTLPGPEAIDGRLKTPGQVHEAYTLALVREKALHAESIAVQEKHLQQFYQAWKGTLSPFKRFRAGRAFKRARGQFMRSRELQGIWERTVDVTQARMNAMFGEMDAEMKAGRFSAEKFAGYYVPELRAAIEEYRSAKYMIGNEIMGAHYRRRILARDRKFGNSTTPELMEVVQRAKKRLDRTGFFQGKIERGLAKRAERIDGWIARVMAEQETREPAGTRA